MKSKWNRLPREFIGTMNLSIITRNKRIAFKLFDSVVELSPVRTGQFRASWQMTINYINNTVVIGGAPGNPLGPPKRPNLDLKTRRDKVIISNAHRYGEYLEYGTPNMAPVAMVRKSLVRVAGIK